MEQHTEVLVVLDIQKTSKKDGKSFNHVMKLNLNFRLTYILFVFLFILSGKSFAQNATALHVAFKPVHITGRITEPSNKTISLHLVENPITQQEKIYEVPLNDVGGFHFEFPLKHPSILKIRHAEQTLQVYMEPGDAIKFVSKSNQLWEAVAFEGKAALHNQYFKESYFAFKKYTEEFISEEIINQNSLNFRFFMDKLRAQKLQLLEDFEKSNEKQFSKNFSIYAESSINYWWAYHLMRYRTEHPAGNNMSVPMSLPISYYDFLLEIPLSNDIALINQDYLYFLDIFLDFAKENPVEWQNISKRSNEMLVINSSVMILKDGKDLPILYTIDKGKALQIIDKRLKENQIISKDKFYKVQAHGGMEGWMRGRDIAYSNKKPGDSNNRFTEKKEVESSYMEPYIEGRFHRTEIRELPHENKVLGYLHQGEEAAFLLNQTSEKFRYPHSGKTYLDYWYKIRTNSGLEGWVFRGGVDMKERKVTVLKLKEIPVEIGGDVAKAYLTGQSLYYSLAKDIYQRAATEKEADLKTDVFNFLRLNPIEDYDRVVQKAYQDALENTTKSKKKRIVNVPPSIAPKDNTVVLNKKEEAKISTKDLVEIDNLPCELNKKSVVLNGKVSNPTRKKIKVTLYLDPILFQEEVKEININPDGSFQLDFKLSEAINAELKYGSTVLELFLEPEDNLKVSFNGSEIEKSIVFEGKGSNNNNYLKEKNLLFKKQKEDLRTKLQYSNPKEFKEFLDLAAKNQQEFFNKYNSKNVLSQNYKSVAQANITYWKAFNLLNYPYEHPLYNDQPAPMKVADDYYSFLNEIDLEKENGFPSKDYAYFLQQYLDHLALLPKNKGKTHYKIAEENLNKEAYYYCAAKSLVASCRRGNLKEAGKEIEDFLAKCPYNTFSNVLRFAYNESKGLVAGSMAPDFELTDINGQLTKLSDFKGKVVYIDFWATWCAPCRNYLPHNQKLATKFESEDVVFLYISLDDKKSDWENYVRSQSLTGVHVCAKTGHGYHSKIAELYKVKSLPSYFLIDKNGRIAQNPAANPMGSKIINQIEELLEKDYKDQPISKK